MLWRVCSLAFATRQHYYYHSGETSDVWCLVPWCTWRKMVVNSLRYRAKVCYFSELEGAFGEHTHPSKIHMCGMPGHVQHSSPSHMPNKYEYEWRGFAIIAPAKSCVKINERYAKRVWNDCYHFVHIFMLAHLPTTLL